VFRAGGRRVQKPHPEQLSAKISERFYPVKCNHPENSGVNDGVVHSGKHLQDLSDIISSQLSFRVGKDLEILVLRQQLNILQRKHNQTVKPDRVDKMILSVLVVRLKLMDGQTTSRLRNIIRIFQPETVLRWHRELVRLKWTYERKNKGGNRSSTRSLKA